MEPTGTKILIVDDDKFLLGMYSQKFVNKKFNVDIATGSLEALKKLHEGATPDILLLDVIMPNMDGIELLKTIRDEKLVPNAAIIMLTNENQFSQIERAKALNADGYIVKASAIPSEVFDEVVKIHTAKQAQKKK